MNLVVRIASRKGVICSRATLARSAATSYYILLQFVISQKRQARQGLNQCPRTPYPLLLPLVHSNCAMCWLLLLLLIKMRVGLTSKSTNKETSSPFNQSRFFCTWPELVEPPGKSFSAPTLTNNCDASMWLAGVIPPANGQPAPNNIYLHIRLTWCSRTMSNHINIIP